MKKLTEEQIHWLNNVCKGTWTQTNEGIVVEGAVICNYLYKFEKIPVKFYKVSGNFWFSNNKLKNLEGCPEYVEGYFSCSCNNLISLEGCCPEFVGGDFHCYNNPNLTSLEGSPKKVGGDFFCYGNNLTSLEGIGEVKGDIYCCNNKINLKIEKELRPEIFKKIYLTTLEKMFLKL